MIKPTVGRVVWYYEGGKYQVDINGQPYAATIAYVHSDRLVNIGYLDVLGNAHSAQSVLLIQDEDEPPERLNFAQWPIIPVKDKK